MKKKLYVSITAAVLVMACAVVSFATFSDMVTVQYVSGYNGGRQLGVPTMKKTVRFQNGTVLRGQYYELGEARNLPRPL